MENNRYSFVIKPTSQTSINVASLMQFLIKGLNEYNAVARNAMYGRAELHEMIQYYEGSKDTKDNRKSKEKDKEKNNTRRK